MCAEIESCFLEPYGVGHGAHHSGDLTGPSVKALMANAGEVFDEKKNSAFKCYHSMIKTSQKTHTSAV